MPRKMSLTILSLMLCLSGFVYSQPVNLNALTTGAKSIRTGNIPENGPETNIRVHTVNNIVGGAVDDIVFYQPFPELDSIFLDSIFILQGEFEDTNFELNLSNSIPPSSNLARIIHIQGIDETEFGFSVADAGDVNRDGFGDLAVTAPFAGEAGLIYILGIGASLQPDPITPKRDPFTINLEDEIDQSFILFTLEGTFEMPLRQPLGPSADIDGDGLSDVIIPAPQFSLTPDRDEILGYVIYGSEEILGTSIRMDELDPANTLTIISPPISEGQRLNINSNPIVQNVGDVNGDSYNDVIISRGYATEEPYYASLYLLPGGERRVGQWVAEVTGVGDAQIDLPLFADRDSHALNQIASGDLNNDGVSDIAMSFLGGDAKGGSDASGAIMILPGGADLVGSVTFPDDSDRIATLGHAVPNAQFGPSMSIRNNLLLTGAPQTFSPFINGASTGAVYISQETALGAGIHDANAPQRMNAAYYGQFDEQRLGSSQDFFVDRKGVLKMVCIAQGDEEFPDRIGYIVPLFSVKGDLNQDGRRDRSDLFTLSRFWQDVLPGDGSSVTSLQVLNAILGLKTY